MRNLSKLAKTTRVINGLTAATGTTNGTGVDMKGYNSVTFYCLLGTIAASSPEASVTLKAQQTDVEGSPETYADLAGSAVTVDTTADDKVLVLEIDNPRERYVRPVLVRAGGTAVIDGVIALQTHSYDEPVTHSATVAASEYHLAPAEGTA